MNRTDNCLENSQRASELVDGVSLIHCCCKQNDFSSILWTLQFLVSTSMYRPTVRLKDIHTYRFKRLHQQQLPFIDNETWLWSCVTLYAASKRAQLHYRGKLRQTQIYANILCRSVSNIWVRANQHHRNSSERWSTERLTTCSEGILNKHNGEKAHCCSLGFRKQLSSQWRGC